MGRVFANGPGDLGSIPGRVIPKTLKMVLDTSLFNSQQYKLRIKGKVVKSRERSIAFPYTFWSPSTTVASFIYDGDLKAPFSIATTPRCRGDTSPFPGLLLFNLDRYLLMLSVKKGGIKYHFFKSLIWLDLNPGLPD